MEDGIVPDRISTPDKRLGHQLRPGYSDEHWSCLRCQAVRVCYSVRGHLPPRPWAQGHGPCCSRRKRRLRHACACCRLSVRLSFRLCEPLCGRELLFSIRLLEPLCGRQLLFSIRLLELRRELFLCLGVRVRREPLRGRELLLSIRLR